LYLCSFKLDGSVIEAQRYSAGIGKAQRSWSGSVHGASMGGHGVVLSRARGKSERRVELGDGTTFGSGRYLDEAPSTRGAEARSMATACTLWGPPSNTWCASKCPL